MKYLLILLLILLGIGGSIILYNTNKDKRITSVEQHTDFDIEKFKNSLRQKNSIIDDEGANHILKVPEVKTTISTTRNDLHVNLMKFGHFIKIDAVHKGEGGAEFYTSDSGPILRFKDDFKVTKGPDLFVYLSKQKNIDSTKELGEYVSLGRLQAASGEQFYTLPSNYMDYFSVVIWCRAFGVLFSVAELE